MESTVVFLPLVTNQGPAYIFGEMTCGQVTMGHDSSVPDWMQILINYISVQDKRTIGCYGQLLQLFFYLYN